MHEYSCANLRRLGKVVYETLLQENIPNYLRIEVLCELLKDHSIKVDDYELAEVCIRHLPSQISEESVQEGFEKLLKRIHNID